MRAVHRSEHAARELLTIHWTESRHFGRVGYAARRAHALSSFAGAVAWVRLRACSSQCRGSPALLDFLLAQFVATSGLAARLVQAHRDANRDANRDAHRDAHRDVDRDAHRDVDRDVDRASISMHARPDHPQNATSSSPFGAARHHGCPVASLGACAWMRSRRSDCSPLRMPKR